MTNDPFVLGFFTGLVATCISILVGLMIFVVPYVRKLERLLDWYRTRVTLKEPK